MLLKTFLLKHFDVLKNVIQKIVESRNSSFVSKKENKEINNKIK
jgi:hypothetical protein